MTSKLLTQHRARTRIVRLGVKRLEWLAVSHLTPPWKLGFQRPKGKMLTIFSSPSAKVRNNWLESSKFFRKMNFWKMSYDMQWHWNWITSMSSIASPQELHVYGILAISTACITLRLCSLEVLSKWLIKKFSRNSWIAWFALTTFSVRGSLIPIKIEESDQKSKKNLTFSSWSISWVISNSFNNHFYTVSCILLWNTGFWLPHQANQSRYP